MFFSETRCTCRELCVPTIQSLIVAVFSGVTTCSSTCRSGRIGVARSFLGRPTSALSFSHELSFLFFFHQSTVLSSHAADGHQMYFRGSVVGRASTVGIDISPTLPWFPQGGDKKCEIWRRFQHHSTLRRSRLKMQQDPNAETNFFCGHDRPMSAPSLVKLGPRTPENVCQSCPTPKISRRNRAK